MTDINKNAVKTDLNAEFNELIRRLKDLGQTQEQIAETLGVSPSHVSRIKKLERPATVANVRALKVSFKRISKERSKLADASVAPRLLSLFQLDEFSLRRLSATDAVEAFRLLCWARAHERGLPTTSVNISKRVFVADGGIDALVKSKSTPRVNCDDLLGVSTGFQIKTGDFAPWQPSVIHKELFSNSKKKAAVGNLGTEVTSVLKKRQRYVMVCFGVELLSKERSDAVAYIKTAFAKCGFVDADVDVWGQGELLGLFGKYPSLCLRLRGHEVNGICSRDAWADNDDMSPRLRQSPELKQLKEELQHQLRTGEVRHIRLLGEPGIGKTRFALELTAADDFAPVTVYVKGGEAMLHNSLLNELIQPDDRRVALFVVDECSPRDVASIWNVLKGKSERIKLISIYHGEDTTRDDQTRSVDLPRTDGNEIVAILTDHGVGQNEAQRWAEFCEGCPRVAHAVGATLSSNSGDVLTSPTVSLMWDRFLEGYATNETDIHEMRKLVLRYVAIFERFGFVAPVQNEASCIQKMIQRHDTNVTWTKFCEAIAYWRRHKVIQGATTLYITPRLLHVFLFKDFWNRYGNGFDIAKEMSLMPDALQGWFAEMLKHAHECKPAIDSIVKLLGPQGPYTDGKFPDEDGDGRLLMSLSESCPGQVLTCLRRTIGKMNSVAIESLVNVRQDIVWTLEKIAVWDAHFSRAAEILLKIASVDDTTHSNNAVGTFTGLFSLTPGFSATAAAPEKRLRVLKASLNSKSEKESEIALMACAEALSPGPSSRIIGPEYQGHRPTLRFWMPETYAELWDSYFAVWTLLNDYLSRCPKEQRRKVISTIVRGSHWMKHLPRFASKIAPILTALSQENDADVKEIIEFLQFHLKHHSEKLPIGVTDDLRQLLMHLDGDDFASTAKRFIRDLTWDDCDDDEGKKRFDQKLEWLVSIATESPDQLSAELSWLVCETSFASFWFAKYLCDSDPARKFLPMILAEYRRQNRLDSTRFLCGYLASICWKDPREWQTIVLALATENLFATHFSEIVIQSGMSDAVVLKLVELCEAGVLSKEKLKNWRFADALKTISEPVFRKLIELQLASLIDEMWENSLKMCIQYYGDEKALPETFIFRVLCESKQMNSRITSSSGYSWTELATRFIAAYPNRKWDVFKSVLLQEGNWTRGIEHHRPCFMSRLVADDPSKAWKYIRGVLDEKKDGKWEIAFWLSGEMHNDLGRATAGPIKHLAPTELFSWVELDRDERAYWLCQAIPKSLDGSPAGRLTRDFLAKFGEDERTYRAFTVRFRSRSWSGKESEHSRELRDEARNWLKGESNRIVVAWIEEYIESLDQEIQRAEIEEERRF